MYTFLEFLGDIGGLFGALSPIFAMVIHTFTHKGAFLTLVLQMLVDELKEDKQMRLELSESVKEAEDFKSQFRSKI